jgi:glycosyltransferase involved in cell wall biosynthesis
MRLLQEDGWTVSFAASNGLGEPHHLRALQRQGIAIYDASTQPMAELLSTFRFDLAIFAFWQVAEYYLPIVRRHTPDTRVIVDSIDLNFLRDARRVFYEGDGHGLLDERFAAQMTAEINTYAAADGVLAISQKETDWINDLTGSRERAWLVPMSEDRRPSTVPFAKRSGILFIGNFQHSPNVEAVRMLCEEIVPLLDPAMLAKHPISIVGNGLNDTVRSFGEGLPHVRMIGWVPSLEPYLERARLSVLPLPYGAGIKGKLVQALMTGTPTVSTSIGVEGLDIRNEEHVLVADTPEAFAAAMTRLLGDRKMWERLARDGRTQVLREFSEEEEARRFRAGVAAVISRPAGRPILPDMSTEQFQERVNYQYHLQLMPHIRQIAARAVPPGSSVAVINEGSEEFLRLAGRATRPFSQDGRPADSAGAIGQLEALREQGASFLLVPKPAFWWLEHYAEFTQYLDTHYSIAGRDTGACVIYDLLRKPAGMALASPGEGSSHDRPTLDDVRKGTEPARLIAFLLPQFHPIPENDKWWGEGFTEWTNVAKARPLFPGHHQPHVPADLGFYDLRLPDTRQEQVALAREAGIHGFCYYHYWFQGTRLLERPFNDILASGKPNFPFCLCWANEPWSRRWDGRARDMLQEQSYSEEDDLAHIRWLIPALSDERAIKIDGKPVFLVYHAKDLPDPASTADVWRREVANAGLPGIYLIAVETGWDAGWDATRAGFDAKVLFQPQFSMLHNLGERVTIPDRPELRVFDYQRVWPRLANPPAADYRRYQTVFPRWDNTARSNESGVVLVNSTPEAYEEWLRHAVERVQHDPLDHRMVFINAWNEWAEGCHLEPDLTYGHQYLQATRRALDAVRARATGAGGVERGLKPSEVLA